jgi:hypothetical protein
MPFFFDIFPILFSAVFLLVFGVIIYTIFRGIKQERRNDRAPRLTVEAKVVAKRTNFLRSGGANHSMHHGHTTYFVTFQVQSGDRMELQLQGAEFGLLVEGDWGDLTFQGTRYLGFQRKV